MLGGGEDRYRERFRWDRVSFGTHCSNCLSTCSYRVYSAGSSVRWEEQSGTFPATEPGVPDRNPMGCQKGGAWSLQQHSDDRLLHPLRRVGERGEGRWERISWDEALTEIAGAVCDAIDESGTEAVLIDEGPEGGMLTIGAYLRFGSLLGAVSLDGNATVNDFPAGHYITFGTMAGGSAAEDSFHADLVLIWHANPAYTRIPYFHYLPEARYRGAEIVLIAPDFSPSAPHADMFVPVEPGSDAALALSMCRVIVDEDLVDEEFVTSQTDLPLLVRCDDGRFLRECDMVEGGSDMRFYVWDSDHGAVLAPDDRLGFAQPPALRGCFEVSLPGGEPVAVSPVFELLVERLGDYAPDDAARTCGVHPDTIRLLARKVATGRTKLHEGFDTAKHYHGDLMERSIDLLLALSGNWGRQGTGFDTFCSFPFDGAYMLGIKARPGLEAAAEALNAAAMLFGSSDGSQAPPGLPRPGIWEMMSLAALAGANTPPFFFWLNHCGYSDIWNRNGWGASPRPFAEYVKESRNQWAPFIRPAADQKPRVLLEVGTNALRRTRGGRRMLLENLWPELSMVVSIDPRMNTAGMHADILLPAAHELERVNCQYPISHSMELAFSDQVSEPAGEARSDWQIMAGLAQAIAAQAERRGMGDVTVGRAPPRPLKDLGDAFRIHESLDSDEAVLDEMVRDTALAGVLDPDTSLAKLREHGWARVIGNGSFPGGRLIGSAIDPHETYSGYRWHVEDGMPYATLTGRAGFYVDHDWFLEAGEALPCHKPPPATGGDHPFALTGGHPRWSIHACNATNPLMLETTRGHPTIVLNQRQAIARGVEDDQPVRVFNDLGSFVVRARLSPAVRPGQVVLYASWEPYGFEGWADGTQVEAGMVKWLHLATGWGHLRYTPMQWQPAPFDRLTRVDIGPA
ncbi:MAG: Dimethylsulfide dehydrogenase subunit alpha [Acidimicrobiales bacterium]|nr:Dimethylsulfide dehydrogenase subunit alpha [Acidimicrobiales bacterium]